MSSEEIKIEEKKPEKTLIDALAEELDKKEETDMTPLDIDINNIEPKKELPDAILFKSTGFDEELKDLSNNVVSDGKIKEDILYTDKKDEELKAEMISLQKEYDNVPKPWSKGENAIKRSTLKKRIKEIDAKIINNQVKITNNMIKPSEEAEGMMNLCGNIGYNTPNLKVLTKERYLIERNAILKAATEYYGDIADTLVKYNIMVSDMLGRMPILKGYDKVMNSDKQSLKKAWVRVLVKYGMQGYNALGMINHPVVALAALNLLPMFAIAYANKYGVNLPKPLPEEEKKKSAQVSGK